MSEINPPRIGVWKTRPMASVTNGTRSGLDLILLQLAHWQKARGSCRRQRLRHLPGRRTIMPWRTSSWATKGIIANGAANAPTR